MKQKLLLLHEELKYYRVPTWNILTEKYDVTLGFVTKDLTGDQQCLFHKKKFEYYKLGPFKIIKGFKKFARQFDIIVATTNPFLLNFCFSPLICRKLPTVSWSIGFRCSYKNPYLVDRRHTIVDWYYKKVDELFDANIFYMEKAKEFWKGTNLNMKKVFIAPNTTEVEQIDFIPVEKKNILFVGTLYKGKGLDLLISAFNEACHTVRSISKLIIVGGGVMREELERYVKENNIEDKVEFTGPIFDEKILCKYFQQALLCVSPTQGGLTCPKSMGYGVPFVCRKDAITGGEIYHMTSGENGVMYENDSDLTDILIDAFSNPRKYIMMGERAREYYNRNATPRHMAQGILDAVEYAIKNNK